MLADFSTTPSEKQARTTSREQTPVGQCYRPEPDANTKLDTAFRWPRADGRQHIRCVDAPSPVRSLNAS